MPKALYFQERLFNLTIESAPNRGRGIKQWQTFFKRVEKDNKMYLTKITMQYIYIRWNEQVQMGNIIDTN